MSGADFTLDELLEDDGPDLLVDEFGKDEHQEQELATGGSLSFEQSQVEEQSEMPIKASSSEDQPLRAPEKKEGRIINLNRSSSQNNPVPIQSITPQVKRYFLIKSVNLENIHKSVDLGAWATLRKNEAKLNDAFQHAEVFLIFSVNLSRQFQGFAKMTTMIGGLARKVRWNEDSNSHVNIGESFGVEWKCLCDVPHAAVEHLRNPWNENKQAYAGRDCQELPADVGGKVVKAILDHAKKTGARPPKEQMSMHTSGQHSRGNRRNQGPGPPPPMYDGPGRIRPRLDGLMSNGAHFMPQMDMHRDHMAGYGPSLGLPPPGMPPPMGMGPGPGVMMPGYVDPMAMAHSMMYRDSLNGGIGLRPQPPAPYPPAPASARPPAPPPKAKQPPSTASIPGLDSEYNHSSLGNSVGVGLGLGKMANARARSRSPIRSQSPDQRKRVRNHGQRHDESPRQGERSARPERELMDMTYDEYLEQYHRVQNKVKEVERDREREREREKERQREREREVEREKERQRARELERERERAAEREKERMREREREEARAREAIGPPMGNPLMGNMFGMPGMPGMPGVSNTMMGGMMNPMNPMMGPGMGFGMQMQGMGMQPYSEAEYIRICQAFFTSQGRPAPSEDYIRHYYRMQRQQQLGM